MGHSFSNLQIRTDGGAPDIERILGALTAGKNLRRAGAEDDDALVIAVRQGPGWTTVVSDLFEGDDAETVACARLLSETLRTEVLAVYCFDSDYLFLNLLDSRSGTDAWAACGHCPGKAPRRSGFAAWKGRVPDAEAFREVVRSRHLFAEDCLAEAGPMLGLPVEQALLSADSAEADGFLRFRYSAEGDPSGEPPRFMPGMIRPSTYGFGVPNIARFLNHGGASRGVGVFIGGEPFDMHQAEIESVRLQFRGPKGEWIFVPVEMRRTALENGLEGLYGECPSVKIPKAVPEGLPPRRRMDLEFARTLDVRFQLRRGYRQDGAYGSIRVALIPLRHPAGQAEIAIPFVNVLPF